MTLFQSLLNPVISRWWLKKLWKDNDFAAKKKCFPKKSINATALSPAVVQNLTRPSAAQRKLQAARARFYYWGRAGVAKSFLPGRFTTGAKEKTGLLLPSIALVSRRSCWRANCLATKKGLLPVLVSSREERSKSATAERSFSTKSAIFPKSFKLSCCDSCRSGSLSGWAAPSSCGSTLQSPRHPTPPSRRRSKRGLSVKIYFIVSTSFPSYPLRKRAKRRCAGSGPVFRATIF